MTQSTATQVIYTESMGTNCYLGETAGIVTGRFLAAGKVVGAFVKLDTGGMAHVTLGPAMGDRGQWHEVVRWLIIDRDDFDRITGLDEARRDWGWAE